MSLRIYNTLTRKKELFEPIEPGRVGLYTCGPTVYNYAHIGNLRTYVFEDVLKRVLMMCGYEVRHVMNVTDVGHLVSDADEGEDKMVVGAMREGKSVHQIADFYWNAFRNDLKRLNIIPPDVWCKATDHINEQIDLVKKLEENGFTYVLDDGVYFDTSKLPDYGKLARLDIAGLKSGARIEMVAGKRNPTDFALWKFSPTDKQRLMEWPSPWGVGFPGWHVECSAMAIKYLGERMDIHCGGIDHVAVHHTNEIAQSESALGHKWVNWWMHGEFLTFPKSAEAGEGERMSKSSGEFLTLEVLSRRGFEPSAYRFFLLGAHYRQQLAFTWDGLESAANAYNRLKRMVLETRKHYSGSQSPIEAHISEFRAAVEDDLNMPQALAAMWGMLKDTDADKGQVYATLLAMDEILGMGMAEMKENEISISGNDLQNKKQQNIQRNVEEIGKELQEIIRQRMEATDDQAYSNLDKQVWELTEVLLVRRFNARKEGDYALGDLIRTELEQAGYEVKDLPDGGTRLISMG